MRRLREYTESIVGNPSNKAKKSPTGSKLRHKHQLLQLPKELVQDILNYLDHKSSTKVFLGLIGVDANDNIEQALDQYHLDNGEPMLEPDFEHDWFNFEFLKYTTTYGVIRSNLHGPMLNLHQMLDPETIEKRMECAKSILLPNGGLTFIDEYYHQTSQGYEMRSLLYPYLMKHLTFYLPEFPIYRDSDILVGSIEKWLDLVENLVTNDSFLIRMKLDGFRQKLKKSKKLKHMTLHLGTGSFKLRVEEIAEFIGDFNHLESITIHGVNHLLLDEKYEPHPSKFEAPKSLKFYIELEDGWNNELIQPQLHYILYEMKRVENVEIEIINKAWFAKINEYPSIHLELPNSENVIIKPPQDVKLLINLRDALQLEYYHVNSTIPVFNYTGKLKRLIINGSKLDKNQLHSDRFVIGGFGGLDCLQEVTFKKFDFTPAKSDKLIKVDRAVLKETITLGIVSFHRSIMGASCRHCILDNCVGLRLVPIAEGLKSIRELTIIQDKPTSGSKERLIEKDLGPLYNLIKEYKQMDGERKLILNDDFQWKKWFEAGNSVRKLFD